MKWLLVEWMLLSCSRVSTGDVTVVVLDALSSMKRKRWTFCIKSFESVEINVVFRFEDWDLFVEVDSWVIKKTFMSLRIFDHISYKLYEFKSYLSSENYSSKTFLNLFKRFLHFWDTYSILCVYNRASRTAGGQLWEHSCTVRVRGAWSTRMLPALQESSPRNPKVS